ncbi:MAG: hypothetical protein WDZ77_00355 [Candidatus Pacearchaeota archaeon]
MASQKTKQINAENKILRNFFISIFVFILFILAAYLFIDNLRHFEYEGVEFQTVSFCDAEPCLVLYKTTFPVITGEGRTADMYLRNDPRELKDIEFNGSMNLFGEFILDSTNDFNCEGDGVIAIANMVQFYELFGVNIFKNDSISCDETSEHTYVRITEGNETRVQQTGLSCYDIEIKNCEILEGTERFLLESFVKVNKLFF